MAVGTDPAKLVITDSNLALKKNPRGVADDETQSADVASSLGNTIQSAASMVNSG